MDRVVTYDHLGFGFSDKPVENYTYSLLDQAEQSLQLWRILGRLGRVENYTYSYLDQAEQSLQLWCILGRQGEELYLLPLGPGGAVPSALAYIR